MSTSSLPEIVARLKLTPALSNGESIEFVLRMFSDDLLASIRESCLAQHGAGAIPADDYDLSWFIAPLGWRLTNLSIRIWEDAGGAWKFREVPGCERLDLLLEDGNSQKFDQLVTALADARRWPGGLAYRSVGPAETPEPATA